MRRPAWMSRLRARNPWPRSLFADRSRLARLAITTLVVAVVLAATFAVGYRSTRAVLGDGSAYVQKGHTVAHVSAESGEVDAEAARDLATKRQRLEIVQVSPDKTYVVNNETDEVWLLPSGSMRPERVQVVPGAPAVPSAGPTPAATAPGGGDPGDRGHAGANPLGTHPLAGGGVGYLLDTEAGALSLLDGGRAVAVALPARADEAVVDRSGTAWVLSRESGNLYEVVGGALRRTISGVANPGEPARLTLSADNVVVLLPERGEEGLVRVFGHDVARPEISVAPRAGSEVVVARPGADARVLVGVARLTRTVFMVDLTSGEESTMEITGRDNTLSYGAPVVVRNRVYVPDYTNREVIVFDLPSLRQVRRVVVPGREGQFELEAREGRVWAHQAYSSKIIVFVDGQQSDASKGDGRGVDDGPTVAPTPAPSGTPPRTQPPRTQPPKGQPTATRPAPPPVPVPDLRKTPAAKACETLRGVGLECGTTTVGQPPDCQTDTVIETIPGPGSLRPRGTRVNLVVCGKPVVGKFVDTYLDQACATLQAADLVCAGVVGGVAQTPQERGKVIAQDVPVGTAVATKTTVTLTYLDMKKVLMPSVVGLGPQQACDTLALYGFACAPDANEGHWEINVVHSQDVAAGTPAEPGAVTVGIHYEDIPPVPLNRYKLSGEEVRYLSTGGPPAGSWVPQPVIGSAYPTGVPVGAPGQVISVFQYRCYAGCLRDRPVAYYYSNDPNALSTMRNRWTPEGAVFSCFNPAAAPALSRPLVAMRNSTTLDAWAFAVRGSGEYTVHYENGYREQFVICHIW
jgi:hypothetical protein